MIVPPTSLDDAAAKEPPGQTDRSLPANVGSSSRYAKFLGLLAEAEPLGAVASDSIEHIGYFSGGGMSGVAGCTRGFALSGDVDVLQHYRAALPAAGWEVVEDDGRHLRAQRDGLAFEVMPCPGGGVVWAGSDDDPAYGQGRPELAGTEICPHDL